MDNHHFTVYTMYLNEGISFFTSSLGEHLVMLQQLYANFFYFQLLVQQMYKTSVDVIITHQTLQVRVGVKDLTHI